MQYYVKYYGSGLTKVIVLQGVVSSFPVLFNIMKWKEETTLKHQGKLIEMIVMACAHERHALRVLAVVGKFKNGTANVFRKFFFAELPTNKWGYSLPPTLRFSNDC
jgi:hypothetical protein